MTFFNTSLFRTRLATLLLPLLPFTLQAQDSAPVASNLVGSLSSHFSQKINTLLADTTVTYQQVEPLFAAFFENYQQKKRREQAGKPKTRYLFVVTTDGLRWQEVFGGADSVLLHNREYSPDPAALANVYWTSDADERRKKLMPFLWSTIAEKGQIYGNRQLGNKVNVANRMWFSYPGYNEIFTGRPDDGRIISNAKLPNPNTNVLEYLHNLRGFKNKVAAYTTWDVFPYILQEKRSKLEVTSGKENLSDTTLSVPHPDVLTWKNAFRHVQKKHPRVLFIGLDETDEHAHEGQYDAYLHSAHQVDAWLAQLWTFIQNDRRYRNKTTLVITTDHGRGDKVKSEWRDHGARIEGADEIWIAAIGPDTPALGEVNTPMQLWQKQLAQTFARLLGQEFRCEHEVAPAIQSMMR